MAKMTTEEFIARAKQVHGDKYDYSKVQVSGVDNKVCIICPEHGEFWQTPYKHLKGQNCPKCYRILIKSIDEFITKAKKVHGDKYDYSKVKYVDASTKVCIVCQEHGEFWQTPSEHLSGHGCKKCAMEKLFEEKKITTKEFIARAKQVHGDKYNYSKVQVNGVDNKVCIICPEHGEFWQRPSAHLRGHGCKKCGNENSSISKRCTTDDFVSKARKVHGDKYDYSKVKYVNSSIKVCIICPEHGEFWQTPSNHWKGQTCPKCAGINKQTTEEFITRAKQVHGDKYDYSKVNYKNASTKVCIICPEHGEFWQTPSKHISGDGCSKCSGNRKLTVEEFIERARKVHGDKYDYSKVEYVNAQEKVCIICPKHGKFWQKANTHLRGGGCCKCAGTNKQTTDEFIEKAKMIHGDKYDYSKVVYKNASEKVIIICREHNYEFKQTPNSHLGGCGCPICNRGYSKQYKFNLLEEFENEYAFRTFLENNDINILLLIITNIEPKYEPLKKDIMFALRHADETNPIQYLREKYSSESNDSFVENTNNTDITSSDSNDDIVNGILSQKINPSINNNLSIGDIIKNDKEEIQVINRLYDEHLITPEIREYIMNKFINDMHRNEISSSK